MLCCNWYFDVWPSQEKWSTFCPDEFLKSLYHVLATCELALFDLFSNCNFFVVTEASQIISKRFSEAWRSRQRNLIFTLSSPSLAALWTMSISHSGTFYKLIVTCVLLGAGSLSSGFPQGFSRRGDTYYDPYFYPFPPSGHTSHNRVIYQQDDMSADSSAYYGDGVLASHPLPGFLSMHGQVPDFMGFGSYAAGNNQYLRAVVPQGDVLEAAAQTYFIEPELPTTTTQRPTFTKRKTRRPITSLAEKQKKVPVVDDSNNDIFQGNPVAFNPFRQIVNTSFGRKRPSTAATAKQGRSRSRASLNKAETQETGSVLTTQPTSIDNSINEIPSSISPPQGEQRVYGRRRPAQDGRPTTSLSPITTSIVNDVPTTLEVERPTARRFPGRSSPTAKPINEGVSDSRKIIDDNSTPRPRSFGKRPRTTTTTASPSPSSAASNDAPQRGRRIRPSKPINTGEQTVQTIGRFSTNKKPRVANRGQVATTSPLQNSNDTPAPNVHRRRPGRPTTTTTAAPTPLTESPEYVRASIGHLNDAPQRHSLREGKQGFVLRPRPTQSTPENAGNKVAHVGSENDVTPTPRPLNRRRKRPTTTVSGVLAADHTPSVSFKQEFHGGVVTPAFPVLSKNIVGEVNNPGRVPRRHPPIRGLSRVTATSLPAHPDFSATAGPPLYQIHKEHPAIQSVAVIGREPDIYKNPPPGVEILQPTTSPSPVSGGPPTVLGRRPLDPLSPVISPIQQTFDSFTTQHPADPHNFVNPVYPPSDNFSPGFPSQFDNVLGFPSGPNFHSNIPQLQQPHINQFSSRSSYQLDEPEISHSDFALPAASSDKEVSVSTFDPSVATDGENQETSKPEVQTERPLTAIERLQKNRQMAAKRLIPRKPTQKTTFSPTAVYQKPGNTARKHVIPPRMLRPRGKLVEQSASDKTVPSESTAAQDNGASSTAGNNGDVATSSADAESNIIPISTGEEHETSSRRPSILENAKRRRISLPGNKSSSSTVNIQQVPQLPKSKAASSPPPEAETPAPPPICAEGERYNKFVKKCVPTYRPKSQGWD